MTKAGFNNKTSTLYRALQHYTNNLNFYLFCHITATSFTLCDEFWIWYKRRMQNSAKLQLIENTLQIVACICWQPLSKQI